MNYPSGDYLYNDELYKVFRRYQKSLPPQEKSGKDNSQNGYSSVLSRLDSLRNTMARFGESTSKWSQDDREYNHFIEFKSFKDLKEILFEAGLDSFNSFEAKFIKPNNLVGWQSTICRCTKMVKLLKSLSQHASANTREYKFSCDNKFLYKKSTYELIYDKNNYEIVVRTGQSLGDRVAEDRFLILYNYAKEALHTLLREMKTELPEAHFDRIFILYVSVKDK